MRSYVIWPEYIVSTSRPRTSRTFTGAPSARLDMAEAILDEVNVKNLFDLRGVVAVVTGGGTVSP